MAAHDIRAQMDSNLIIPIMVQNMHPLVVRYDSQFK